MCACARVTYGFSLSGGIGTTETWLHACVEPSPCEAGRLRSSHPISLGGSKCGTEAVQRAGEREGEGEGR